MHICIDNLTIIGSDNGLAPGRCQAIIWSNADILLGTNFSEISIEIQTFSFKKNAFESVVCKMAAILSRLQCVKKHPIADPLWYDLATLNLFRSIFSPLYHIYNHVVVMFDNGPCSYCQPSIQQLTGSVMEWVFRCIGNRGQLCMRNHGPWK